MTIYGPASSNPERGEPIRMSGDEQSKLHAAAEAEYGIEAKIFKAIEKGCKLMIKNPTTGEVERYRPKKLIISVWQKPEVTDGDDQVKRRLSEEPLIL